MKRKGFIKRFLAMLLVLVMVIPNNMVSMAANDAGDTTSNPPVETELDKESTVDDATDESIEDVEDVDDTTDMGEDKDVDDSTDMGEDEDVDADDVANTDDEESEKDAEDASDDTSVDGEDEETDDTQEKDEEKSEDEKDQPAVQEEEKTEQKTTKVPVRRSMAFRNVRSSTGSMTTEPIKGWNDEHSILTVKNTPESLDEYLKELGDYNKPSTTVKSGKISIPLNWDAIKILPLSYDIHSEDISHNMVYTATAYFEYSSWLGSVSASVELGTFTLKIYDKLTINTTVGSNDTTTETVWLYRDGSHTVTVADKSAENYDVTVTGAVKGTTAGSYIVSKLSSDASVNIVYTLDTQSTVTVDKNEDNATVSVQSSVDANVTVPVEIAPAKNYYVKSVTLTPGTLGNTTYSDGVCKTSFVSAANKTAYVLDVESELVLAPTGTTTINYNSTMDAASLKQEIFKKLVNAPEGVTANNVVVEFKVPEGLSEKTVELTDETIDRFAKTLLGTADEKEKIIISYAGNGAKYPEATTEEMTVSVVDGRLTPTVNLIGNQELGYIGTELNGSTILAKVFQSVTYRNETITEDAEDVTITKIEKYNDTLGKYVNTLKTVIGGSDLQLGEVEGQYRITVGYVGNSTYGKATAEVELKVVDGRLETSINLEEGSLDMPTLDTRFTTNQILDAMKFKVSDENGNKVTDRAEDVVVTLYKGLSKVSEITEAGTYYVGVEYKETSTYKGWSTGLAFGKLTVNDTRIGTSVSLETGSLDMPTLDTTFTNAQILEAMNFVVLDDKANSVTDKAEDVSVVVTPVITVAGEY